MTPRLWLATACAAAAVLLLLWHELATMSGRPAGMAWMLGCGHQLGIGHPAAETTGRAGADVALHGLDDPRPVGADVLAAGLLAGAVADLAILAIDVGRARLQCGDQLWRSTDHLVLHFARSLPPTPMPCRSCSFR